MHSAVQQVLEAKYIVNICKVGYMENEKNIICLSKGRKNFDCKCMVVCPKCDYVLIHIYSSSNLHNLCAKVVG